MKVDFKNITSEQIRKLHGRVVKTSFNGHKSIEGKFCLIIDNYVSNLIFLSNSDQFHGATHWGETDINGDVIKKYEPYRYSWFMCEYSGNVKDERCKQWDWEIISSDIISPIIINKPKTKINFDL